MILFEFLNRGFELWSQRTRIVSVHIVHVARMSFELCLSNQHASKLPSAALRHGGGLSRVRENRLVDALRAGRHVEGGIVVKETGRLYTNTLLQSPVIGKAEG